MGKFKVLVPLSVVMITVLSSCGFQKEVAQPENVSEVQPKAEQQMNTQSWVTQVETEITNSWTIEKTSSWIVGQSSTGAEGSTSFSDAQIKDILAKIDENTRKQQEIIKSSTGTLVQNEFRAEYLPSKDYKNDIIRITINGKVTTIPTVYNKRNANMDSFHFALTNLNEFSPSWRYLFYTYAGGTGGANGVLVDVQTGNEVVNAGWYIWWTKDRKHFIYFWGNEEGGWQWLALTVWWSLESSKTLTDDFIEWWFLDDGFLYVKTYNYHQLRSGSDPSTHFLKVYDLTTLEEVFSKRIES